MKFLILSYQICTNRAYYTYTNSNAYLTYDIQIWFAYWACRVFFRLLLTFRQVYRLIIYIDISCSFRGIIPTRNVTLNGLDR